MAENTEEIPADKKYQPFLPPVVYTLDEIKQKYANRWCIPVEPEIVVRHEGKTYKFNQLKEIWP